MLCGEFDSVCNCQPLNSLYTHGSCEIYKYGKWIPDVSKTADQITISHRWKTQLELNAPHDLLPSANPYAGINLIVCGEEEWNPSTNKRAKTWQTCKFPMEHWKGLVTDIMMHRSRLYTCENIREIEKRNESPVFGESTCSSGPAT